MESIIIKVPSSSANLGPGFDVFGIALKAAEVTTAPALPLHLSFLLELHIILSPSKPFSAPFNCEITSEGQGAETNSSLPDVNLITRVALDVLRCQGQYAFPVFTSIHAISGIPLSRGLGSSAAAVVAGAILGNEVGGFGLSSERILDYCLKFEVQMPLVCSVEEC